MRVCGASASGGVSSRARDQNARVDVQSGARLIELALPPISADGSARGLCHGRRAGYETGRVALLERWVGPGDVHAEQLDPSLRGIGGCGVWVESAVREVEARFLAVELASDRYGRFPVAEI